MKLKDIALLTEIVGGAGILISLVVLVSEVRQNTALVERQLFLDRADVDAKLVDSPYIAPIQVKIKAVDGIDSTPAAFMQQYDLTHDEALRWVSYLRREWAGYEADYHTGDSSDVDARILYLLQFPDFELYWKTEMSKQASDFVEHVRELTE